MAIQLSATDLARLVEFSEANAYRDMFEAAPADLDLRVELLGSTVMLIAPKLDMVLFNRVIGLGLKEPVEQTMLAMITARYRQDNIRNFAVQLSPSAWPAAVPQWLEQHHLLPQDRWAKMYRTPERTVTLPTDLRIERIGGALSIAFGSVICAAFGMPPFLQSWLVQLIGRPGWRHYLAFDGERPVAGAALYIKDGVGWLGMGGTLPNYRRRGAQGALMARRIQDAAEAGCAWIVTETSEDTPGQPNPSYHNMLRAGFELVYQRPNYRWQPAN